MKYEWKKQEKNLYSEKKEPILVEVPKCKYITISGEGNPNKEDFKLRIEALYTIAYTIKMMPRSNDLIDGYFDYTVYPLEGIWDLSEKGRKESQLNKDELVYKIMIKQPSFVTDDVFNKALEKAFKKKKSVLLSEVKLEELEDGLCVQILHLGSYDEEYKSFELIEKFLDDNNLERELIHKEIYLSDARKVDESKFRTILRVFVKEK